MFEFLTKVNFQQAVTVVNHTIKLLEWRRVLARDLTSSQASVLNEPSLTEQEMAGQALEEIQRLERANISEISDAAVEKYLLALARVVEVSTESQLTESDLNRGKMILARWKKEGEAVQESEPRVNIVPAASDKYPSVGPSTRRRREVTEHRTFWDRLCVESYPLLFSYAQTLTAGDLRLAEDISQSAVVKVLRYSPNPSAIRNTTAYLRRVVHNVWIESLQSREAKMDRLIDLENSEPSLQVEPEIMSLLENKEYLEALQFEHKPSPELAITIQLRVEGYTLDEIAHALDEKVSKTRFRWYSFIHSVRRRVDAGSH